MLFQYIGQHKDSPEKVNLFGHDFIKNGEPVEIVKEHHVKKLLGNKSFLSEKEAKAKVESETKTLKAPAKRQSKAKVETEAKVSEKPSFE